MLHQTRDTTGELLFKKLSPLPLIGNLRKGVLQKYEMLFVDMLCWLAMMHKAAVSNLVLRLVCFFYSVLRETQ